MLRLCLLAGVAWVTSQNSDTNGGFTYGNDSVDASPSPQAEFAYGNDSVDASPSPQAEASFSGSYGITRQAFPPAPPGCTCDETCIGAPQWANDGECVREQDYETPAPLQSSEP